MIDADSLNNNQPKIRVNKKSSVYKVPISSDETYTNGFIY